MTNLRVPRRAARVFALCLAALTLYRPSIAAAPALTPHPGYIIGSVKTTQGRPLAGAEIDISGYAKSTGYVSGRVFSNANGLFGARVATDGKYHARATYVLPFGGLRYPFTLAPVDGADKDQPLGQGLVLDFELRLSGQKIGTAGAAPADFNGASVLLRLQNNNVPVTDDDQVTIAFSPASALADGSPAKPIVFHRTFADLARYPVSWHGSLDQTASLYDIPLAQYRVSGFVTLANGSMKILHFYDPANPSRVSDSPNIVFLPTGPGVVGRYYEVPLTAILRP